MLKAGILFVKGMGWKAWIGGAVAALLAILLPSPFIVTLLISTGAMLVLDTVTGILAAKKTGDKIKSAKFGRLVNKMFGTGVLWITLAILGNVVGQMLGIVGLGAVLISAGIGAVFLKEVLSILENLSRMGIYITPALKRRILEWMGDLEGKD